MGDQARQPDMVGVQLDRVGNIVDRLQAAQAKNIATLQQLGLSPEEALATFVIALGTQFFRTLDILEGESKAAIERAARELGLKVAAGDAAAEAAAAAPSPLIKI